LIDFSIYTVSELVYDYVATSSSRMRVTNHN